MNDNTQVVNEQPQEVNELDIDAVFGLSVMISLVPDTPPQPKQPEPLQHDVTLAGYMLLLWLTPTFQFCLSYNFLMRQAAPRSNMLILVMIN